MSYLPLDFVNTDDAKDFFNKHKKWLMEEGLVVNDFTKEEYYDFVFSENFLNPVYRGKFMRLNQYMIDNTYNLLRQINCKMKDVKAGYVSPRTEWMDFTAAPIVVNDWSFNKQVYKMDEDFAMALKDTEKFSLYKTNFEHLPCNPFYIDLSDVTAMYPIHGSYVYTKVTSTKVYIYIIMLRYDKVFFSWENVMEFMDDGQIKIERSSIPMVKSFRAFLDSEKEQMKKNKAFDENGNDIPKADILMLCLQMIIYLSSKEPDIEENPISKQTYKPTKVIRNKYSEVQTHDVGVRYGQSIRINKKKLKEQKKKESEINNEKTKEVTNRKSPKPHFRNAHWSHYWTGKGRTNLEVRWIEPTFVGLGINQASDSDVVIHKVM